MKRRLALLLLALLLLPLPASRAEETPLYTAQALLDFHLRMEPEHTYYLAPVPNDALVRVYEYGEEWCRVGYKNETGWAKTKWLYVFMALDPLNHPLPHRQAAVGILRLTEETRIAGGDFSGLAAAPGALVAVTKANQTGYALPVFRESCTLPLEAGEYRAFAPWDAAAPGDVIGAFTTYYNKKTGGKLAEARAYNIALGCERIDGARLAPGEEFSFNALCGPYRKSNGYQKATNISRDGVGYGGGVCQVTTTLYNALLCLPLRITDWSVHRRSGIPYARQYFDAAVGSYSDLRFVNTLPYPIALTALPQGGAVTALISRASAE